MGYVRIEARREQLVLAAIRVLSRDGMTGLSMRAVATEAGVPLGTIHYAFDNKEQLVRAALQSLVDNAAEHVELDGAADFPDMVRRTVVEAWQALQRRPEGHHLLEYELTVWALRDSASRDLAVWQYEYYVNRLAERWVAAAARFGVQPAFPIDRLARIALAGLDGLMLQHLVHRDRERSSEDVSALSEMLAALAVVPTDVVDVLT